MNDTALFSFESDFVATLRCIPMAVRFKLDTCEIKLSLRQWSRLSREERAELLLRPCDGGADVASYHAYLSRLLAEQGCAQAAALPPGSTVQWDQSVRTPEAIRLFAASVCVDPPSDDGWRALTALQRFTLLKLSRDNHDNVNFIPAMREFGLVQDVIEPPEAAYAANA